MNNETTENQDGEFDRGHNHKRYAMKHYMRRGGMGDGGIGWFMFLAFIGAAIYFVSKATDFWTAVLGILKAIVWPAFLIYTALKGLNV